MARLARVVAAGVPHHVTQRGNARRFVLDCDAGRSGDGRWKSVTDETFTYLGALGKQGTFRLSPVSKKYGVPATVNIDIKSTVDVSGTCYRKLVFGGHGPLGEFSTALYASPDLRFLSQNLLDSSVDPVQERQEKARQVMSQVEAGDVPSLGSPNAALTIVMFSDFECPYCKKAAEMLESEPLIRNGGSQVRILYRHYTLPQHPWAQKAAEAASCAAFQSDNAFWHVHDAIFNQQTMIEAARADEQIAAIASQAAGVDAGRLDDCMKRQLSLGVVLRDKAIGENLGVNATPTFYINGESAQFESAEDLHRLLMEQLSHVSRSESVAESKGTGR